jgi:hypothetical protein
MIIIKRLKRKILKVRVYLDETFRKDEYPLKKNSSGMYPIAKTPSGKIRCPHCGDANGWSLHDFSTLECNVCYKFFNNFGVLGLRPIERAVNVDHPDKFDLDIPKIL